MASITSIIRSRHDDIVASWLSAASPAASARGLTEVALRNVMPGYVSALADVLETGQLPASDRARKFLDSHVSTRIRQGFDLAEIVNELTLLGSSISTTWRSFPRDDWPSPADVEHLHLELQGAISEVTEVFRGHMLEDEQTEKRYLRLLQTIASEGLHGPTSPLRDRLRDVLAIVMEAMGAQCAAFALYDVPRGMLVLDACVGSEALEPYVVSLDSQSFLGEIAAHSEPTAVYDATVTRLELPEDLRRSGIGSLLGIRLPQRNALLAVMYVGIAQRREFTPREVGRIESLGEQLELHLDNARLFSKLHATIGELRAERELRDRFVAVLAHDLRGPLQAAQLAADLLAEQPARITDRPDLAIRVSRNIARADRMIRDLLDASRIHAGEALPLRLAECDLAALAQRVKEEASALYGDRFVVECDQSRLRGIWSEDELHRALWNLVTNAIKYGDASTPIALRVTGDDDTARVSVHNWGPPIPADARATIFDAYVRTPSARSSGSQGWGLGLTLVRGTAEAHGGHVTLRSDPTGTTFTIEIPRDSRPHQSSAAPPPLSTSPTVH
jgi:signal transduction histidine kinase